MRFMTTEEEEEEELEQKQLTVKVRNMTQDKDEVMLLRCQRQLKTKEDEMILQTRYFQDVKTRLQHQLTLSRDREENLQNRVHTLEKQLLEVTVSAATGVPAISQVRITAPHLEDQLLVLRGEGEGEEERKEERRRKWPPGGEERSCKEVQKCLVNLRADLKVLLEREENGMSSRRKMVEDLQEAQESRHLLEWKVEQMEAEILRTRSLLQELDQLREENHVLRENHRTSSTPGPTNPTSISDAGVCSVPSDTDPLHPSIIGKLVPDDQSTAVPPTGHRGAVKARQSGRRLSVETVEDFKSGSWFSSAVLDLDEAPSEESDALREAYRSLGFGEDLRALQGQSECLEVSLQEAQQQLLVLSQENCELKLQLQEQTQHEEEEDEGRKESSLVQALNEENRALMLKIQELLTHVDLQDGTTMKEHISRLELEVREQSGLITELTKKTEDDLNTIMELRQGSRRGQGSPGVGEPSRSPRVRNIDDVIDILVESVVDLDEEMRESPNRRDARPDESIQRLAEEEQELREKIEALKEQRNDVEASVQNQSEEKQVLTRQVWGLKEEKDQVRKTLDRLKQEKEMLNRAVFGLKEQLRREKEKMSSSRSEGGDSIQTLQAEKDQLGLTLLRLKQEKDRLEGHLQALKEEQEERGGHNGRLREEKKKLEDSIVCLREEERGHNGRLREEKKKLEDSIVCLREEERGHNGRLREEKKKLEDSIVCLREEERRGKDSREERKDEKHHVSRAEMLKEIEVRGLNNVSVQKSEVSAALKNLQMELDDKHTKITKLHHQLQRLDVQREESQRAAEENRRRVSDLTRHTEDMRTENQSLLTQVSELQHKVSKLQREKSDQQTLQAQIEEKHEWIAAQLKAKSEALDELNSEFMTLKRHRGDQDDLTTDLVSLRSRHRDLEAKYESLVRAKSPSDLVPLKAQLSCLVLKCQERNQLLLQVTRLVRPHARLDTSLSQRVDKCLRDATLDQYSRTWTLEGLQHRRSSTPGPLMKEEHAGEVAAGHVIEGGDVMAVLTVALEDDDERPATCLQENDSMEVQTSADTSAEQRTSKKVLDHRGLDRRSESSPDLSLVGLRRRLSSPEKILSLHQQLQQTLLSSYQAPAGRGREDLLDKSPSCVSSRPPSRPASSPVTMATNQTPPLKSLFEAVTSRSANMSRGPLTRPDIPPVTPQFQTSKTTTLKPKSNGSGAASSADRKSISAVSVDFKTPATSNVSFRRSTLDDGSSDSLSRSTSCSHLPGSSGASPALEKKKVPRPDPEAPSEVGSARVIKRVGQSSLLIGWDRPPLDELGCSNGTFVYGYRVFVDGIFHKSVLSSACTKCVLENVPPTVPVDISIQTLGSNGLCSNRVQVVFESVGSDEQ